MTDIYMKFDYDDKHIRNVANAVYRDLCSCNDPNFSKATGITRRLNGTQQFKLVLTHHDVEAALRYMLNPTLESIFPGIQGTVETGVRVSEFFKTRAGHVAAETVEPGLSRTDKLPTPPVATCGDSARDEKPVATTTEVYPVDKIRLVSRNRGVWVVSDTSCQHPWACHDDGIDHCLLCGVHLRRES